MSHTVSHRPPVTVDRSSVPSVLLWTGTKGPYALWGHAVFWVLVLVFYTFLFRGAGERYVTSLIFVLLLLPNTAVTSYFLIHFLIPRYLLARRYGLFALYLTYTVLTSLYVQVMTVLGLLILVAEFHASRIDPETYDVFSLLAGMYVIVFFVVAANLVERWFHAQAANQRLAESRARIELELKEAQLALLKSQIRPHFLFNTLNNLYSLTLVKSDQAPDAILHLSDMLDYALYRGEAVSVPLEEELDFLRDYVELERLRYNVRVDIRFEVDPSVSGYRIAPLLLIPFVENGFKHGVSQFGEGAWIHVRAAVDDGWLVFRVDNSMPDGGGNRADTLHSGVGLKNVVHRLELLYADAHTLTTESSAGTYHTLLHLKLDPDP